MNLRDRIRRAQRDSEAETRNSVCRVEELRAQAFAEEILHGLAQSMAARDGRVPTGVFLPVPDPCGNLHRTHELVREALDGPIVCSTWELKELVRCCFYLDVVLDAAPKI